MKKILILLLATALFCTLVACTVDTSDISEPTETPTMPETTLTPEVTPSTQSPPPDLMISPPAPMPGEVEDLQISLAHDALLASFDYLHHFDHMIVETPARKADSEGGGHILVIWSDAPIRDFSMISIVRGTLYDEPVFVPTEHFGFLDEIKPGQAIVIHSYVDGVTHICCGITFVDEHGETKYYVIAAEPAGFEPSIWDADITEQFVDGMLKTSLIGNGGLIREFTIWHDGDEAFDPHKWEQEHLHLIITFRLLAFQNRVDELPDDWEPW